MNRKIAWGTGIAALFAAFLVVGTLLFVRAERNR